MVTKFCPDSLIVRTNFFGWSIPGKKSILEFFVNALRRSNQVTGFEDSIAASIYVDSLLEIIFKLESLNTSGIVHVGSDDALSKYDFGLTTAASLHIKTSLITPQYSSERNNADARNRNLSLNSGLIESIIGESMPSQKQGIEEALHIEQQRRDLFGAQQRI